MTDAELLKFAIENGIIDTALLQEKVEMQKREELLKRHPYQIWEGKNGKWYTYLPNKEKGRVLKKRKTKKDIQDVIVSFYKESDEGRENGKITFKDYFIIWRERQKKCGISDSTIDKYNSDYIRFFKNDNAIAEKEIYKIDDNYIEEFIFRTLERLDIKYQALLSMFHILNNVMKKAKRDKIIKNNPCDYIDIETYKKRCKVSVFEVNKRVLSKQDCNSLIQVIQKDYSEKPNYIPSYSVELALLTGMRAGELAFLQWEHINLKDGFILVCGSEKYNQGRKEYWDDRTKTGKERRIPLTDEMREFFKRLKSIEMQYGYLTEYVFSNENGRIHRGTLCSCAMNKCNQAGTTAKGLQTMRRTFNSQLKTDGVSTTVASAILGHCSEVNEKFYTYDVSDMDYKETIVGKINKKMFSID